MSRYDLLMAAIGVAVLILAGVLIVAGRRSK